MAEYIQTENEFISWKTGLMNSPKRYQEGIKRKNIRVKLIDMEDRQVFKMKVPEEDGGKKAGRKEIFEKNNE